jgi:hypothetical protein
MFPDCSRVGPENHIGGRIGPDADSSVSTQLDQEKA